MKQISPHRRSLQLQLAALYFLMVMAIFVLAYLFYLTESRRIRANVVATDLSLAHAIALETDATLQKAQGAVEAFAQMPAVIEVLPASLDTLFAAGAAARQDINLFYRLSKDGIMVYQYPWLETSTIGRDYSFRPYFIEVKQTQNHVLSRGRISPTTGRPVVSSVMPVFKGGEFDGVVAINLELQRLTETVRDIALKRHPQALIRLMIVDSAGQIIAHSEPDLLLENMHGQLPVLPALFAGQEGSLLASDRQGEQWLYTYTPIPHTGWGVIVQHPATLAFASLRAFQQGLLITLLIFTFGALAFWWFLSRRVIQPLESLTRYGDSVSKRVTGRSQPVESLQALVKRPDQIGQLALTLQEAEKQIARRFRELTTLNRTSAAVVATLDTEQVINTILNELQQLLQVRQCALLIVDESNHQLQIRESRGLSQRYVEHIATMGTSRQLPAYRAIMNQRPIQVPDVEKEADFAEILPLAKGEGYRSLLVFPLVAPHVPPSALAIYRPDVHHYTKQEVDLAASFANYATIALEHAMLFNLTDAELEKQVNFLSALNRVGHTVSQSLVVDDVIGNAITEVFEVMPADACWICLQRENESFLRLRDQRGFPEHEGAEMFHHGRAVFEQVIQQQQTLLLNHQDLHDEAWHDDPILAYDSWRWVLITPLVVTERPIGTLGIATQKDRPLEETEVKLLQAIGDQIAIAVMNARLYRRSREMAMLEERNRVAREIHDTLAQGFTGILIQLQAAERLSQKYPEKAVESLQQARELARESLQEARRSVLNLRPTILQELPLDEAIAQQVRALGQEAEFILEGYPSTLDSHINQNLYRITQEALTNIKRHAQANHVTVRLTYEPHIVTLRVVDDGIGLTGQSQHQGGGGFGLVGIKERVTLMGGQIYFNNPAPCGTEIKVVVSK